MTTGSFLYTCRYVGLSFEDMDLLTIGMCLDFVEEYNDHNTPENEKTRKASQADFDSF